MVRGSPSLCLSNHVTRLDQTAEQLNAIDDIIQVAPRFLARSRGRHIGGYIIPFFDLMAAQCCRLADKYSIARNQLMQKNCPIMSKTKGGFYPFPG